MSYSVAKESGGLRTVKINAKYRLRIKTVDAGGRGLVCDYYGE
jgi:hypothetical protein